MKIFLKTATILTVIVLGLGLAFLVTANFNPELPEGTWHIQGRVLNQSSNSVSGVKVAISGIGKVTAINKLGFASVRKVSYETLTDENGNFRFNFRASGFSMDLSKAGFKESRCISNWLMANGGSTNQNLTICLIAK